MLAAISYAGRLAGGEPPDDVLYLWSTVVGALVQYAIMLILVLAIARGFDRRLLALEVPGACAGGRWAWPLVALVVIVATAGDAEPVPRCRRRAGPRAPGMGLEPRSAVHRERRSSSASWRRSSRSCFSAGSATGSCGRSSGPWPAILITGRRVRARPRARARRCPSSPSSAITLGWLRWQTGSVYPGMVVHAVFNAAALACGGADMSERFEEIRRQITENDEAIVAAVNRRLELVDRALGAEGASSASAPSTPSASGACASGSRRRTPGPLSAGRARSARDRAARPDEGRTRT